MEQKYYLRGLDCAHCATKIEDAVKKIPATENVQVNFLTTELCYTCAPKASAQVEEEIRTTLSKIEPDVTLEKEKKKITIPAEAEGNTILKIIAGVFIGLVVMHFVTLPLLPTILIYVALYLAVGFPVVKKAVQNLAAGLVFDENFLMTVATIGALAIQEFPEAVAVMLFYQLGEFFQDRAVESSRKAIQEALNLRPDFARVIRDGQDLTVDPREVQLGELVRVKPGEKVPLDGTVTVGDSYFDTSALTGEAVPKHYTVGATLLSGMINTSQSVTLKVTKDADNSTAAQILALVENATSKKAPAEQFITRFARYYTPVVVLAAAFLGVGMPLITQSAFQPWIYRALTFLVISCPCALVISVPLSFFAGLGGASKKGILIKGSTYLEKLAQAQTFIFDKTGTLTKGNFVLTDVLNADEPAKVLQLAASLEQDSPHPIAKVILAKNQETLLPVSDLQEKSGYGLVGTWNQQTVRVGNDKLMKEAGLVLPAMDFPAATLVHVALGTDYLGTLVIQDELKDEAATALTNLKKNNRVKTVLLSGDSQKVAKSIGGKLHLDEVYGELLPQDKVQHLEEALHVATAPVAFVGDGMNDAPVLARADVGISMGALGSDAAIEASDVVIMDDNLEKLPQAVTIAKKTLLIVKENIIFALGIKFIVLTLGALGIASMALAVFADVGVTLLAVLNALRALRNK